MFHCVIRGPIPVFLIRSFSSPQFPHCFIKGLHFPHCVIKGQRVLNFPLRHQGPSIDFLIMSSKWRPLISHHIIKGPNSSLRYQGGPIIFVTSNFPSRTYVSDGYVRTRVPKKWSFGDKLNREKRGSFSEDKRKIGGHLVRTVKRRGSFSEDFSLKKKKRFILWGAQS